MLRSKSKFQYKSPASVIETLAVFCSASEFGGATFVTCKGCQQNSKTEPTMVCLLRLSAGYSPIMTWTLIYGG